MEPMDIPQKLLIDAEKNNNVAGYEIISIHGKEIEYVVAGKMIAVVSKNDRNDKIYKLLQENCDVISCTTSNMDDFPFYPVPSLTIFAHDSKGNRFGTIGGMCDLVSDDYPVGYINQHGMYGKISSSLKEFFELVIFYPYWGDIIKYEQMGLAYDIDNMEMKQWANNSKYFENQSELSEILKLSKNPKSIELLISNMRSESGFVVYSSIDEAKITNMFVEDIFDEEYYNVD